MMAAVIFGGALGLLAAVLIITGAHPRTRRGPLPWRYDRRDK